MIKLLEKFCNINESDDLDSDEEFEDEDGAEETNDNASEVESVVDLDE